MVIKLIFVFRIVFALNSHFESVEFISTTVSIAVPMSFSDVQIGI